jgi:tetratricopeptide (TPR) repeat protein
MPDPARTLYEALRALEHRARAGRQAAGLTYSRRETAREVRSSYGVDLHGQRISQWLPDDPGKAQVPRDSDEVWALVRLWSGWAGDSAGDQRYWSDLVEAAQPYRTPGTAALAAPGRPLGEFTDPFVLEVHQAVDVDDLRADGHADGLPPLPAYVCREHDMRLGQAVDRAASGQNTIVMLVGGSSTGKTRACWEAIQRLPGDWRLWHPLEPSPPESVLQGLNAITSRTVLWLNEAQQYLLTHDPELGERVAAGLRELLRDPRRGPVLVLGTIWPEYRALLTAEPDPAGPGRRNQARALLTGTSIEVPEKFTRAAIQALRSAADPRLVQAALYAEDGQITQYLAGVPVLLERYRIAPAPAKALIHAAMDIRRLGHGPMLPCALLAAAAPGYLTGQQWEALDDDWPDQALAYTGQPCRGVRGPLTPLRARPGQSAPDQPYYRLSDYLDQIGRAERRTQSVPAALWDALLAHSKATDLAQLGRQAEERGLYRYAFRFYSAAAKAGDPRALSCMGGLFWKMGRTDEAITWLQARVDAGESECLHWLANMLRDAGRTEEAMAVYRRSADNGSANDMRWLASMLRAAGRTDEAIVVYQRAVEAYGADSNASSFDLEAVERLMTEAGRVVELISWLKIRAEAGNGIAGTAGARLLEKKERYEEAASFCQLAAAAHGADTIEGLQALGQAADLMKKAGRIEEAIAIYQQIADMPGADPWLAGSAEYSAAKLLRNSDRADEALTWLSRRATAGQSSCHQQVTELLKEKGQLEEAITWLETLARAGDRNASWLVTDLLEEAGRTEEAISWLKSAAKASGHHLRRLADKLVDKGRAGEAIELCRHAADNGDTYGRMLAAELLQKEGRTEEAIAVLPVAAISGTDKHSASMRAARARLLREAGREDEAIGWLKDRAEAGDTTAAEMVTGLLLETGQDDEAIGWLKDRAEAGDTAAARRAAAMLHEAGRAEEMITWLSQLPHPGWSALMQAADTLRETGRTEEAVTFYQRAADADDADQGTAWLQAAIRAVELLESGGRTDEAIGWLTAQAEVGQTRALEEAARVLHNVGRTDEALIYWGRAIEAGNYRLSPMRAVTLRTTCYAEYADRICRYGIEPGGSAAHPWPISMTWQNADQ